MNKKRKYASLLEQVCSEYGTQGYYNAHVPSHHVYYVRAGLKERTVLIPAGFVAVSQVVD